ncbi:MAG: hypothetical protein QW578_08425 [Thermoplasmatales archaeon]
MKKAKKVFRSIYNELKKEYGDRKAYIYATKYMNNIYLAKQSRLPKPKSLRDLMK